MISRNERRAVDNIHKVERLRGLAILGPDGGRIGPELPPSCPIAGLFGTGGRDDAFRSGDPALLRQRGPKARGRTGTGTGRTEVAQKSSKSAVVDAVDAVNLTNSSQR
jgi:hypothetical protein